MNRVDLMRALDYWIGVPACFLLSILSYPFRVFRKTKTPNIANTLFIELSEMGSVILADPTIRKIKAHASKTFFVIFKDNAQSLNITNSIPKENIFQMNPNNILIFVYDILRFIFWCRKNKITTTIDLELFARFSIILSFFSGAKSRIGYTTLHDEGCYRGSFLNYPVRYNPHAHIAVNFMSLANRALGKYGTAYSTEAVDKASLKPERATVEEHQITDVTEKIKQLYPSFNQDQNRLIIINPNASDLLPQRRWLAESFVEVIQKLLAADPSFLILITGAPKEREGAEKIRQAVNDPRCINTAGVFKFSELVPLYSLSTVMLTNDSGPAHFAAVTDLKVFVIFGPETPNLYLPVGHAEAIYLGLPCSPCVSAYNHRKTTCVTRPCITGIGVDMVYDKINGYLSSL